VSLLPAHEADLIIATGAREAVRALALRGVVKLETRPLPLLFSLEEVRHHPAGEAGDVVVFPRLHFILVLGVGD